MRLTALLSYAVAAVTLGIFAAFVQQAGLFQILVPAEKPAPPEVKAPEQVTSRNSTITGLDNQNLPYSFSAETAMQDRDAAHLVHLETLSGAFRRPGGQDYDVSAKTGRYDTKLETLDLSGDVKVKADGRFEAAMSKAHVAIKLKTLESDAPVTVLLSDGSTVDANGLKITDDGNHILFLNGVKAKFKASVSKGDAQP